MLTSVLFDSCDPKKQLFADIIVMNSCMLSNSNLARCSGKHLIKRASAAQTRAASR
jgi:hypothetical protein